MKQEFEAKYNITVNYVRMSSGEALARLQAEKDNPSFDIWWGGPVTASSPPKRKPACWKPTIPRTIQPDRPGESQRPR
jgi:ABC-type glycerol-3-phosphate transport system substrate-binding protein